MQLDETVQNDRPERARAGRRGLFRGGAFRFQLRGRSGRSLRRSETSCPSATAYPAVASVDREFNETSRLRRDPSQQRRQ